MNFDIKLGVIESDPHFTTLENTVSAREDHISLDNNNSLDNVINAPVGIFSRNNPLSHGQIRKASYAIKLIY